MGKIIIGSVMLVAGLFLSFVPPFIFGPILFISGLVVGAGGMFGVTKDAAKATASGIKAVQTYQKEKGLAERERALEERERALQQSSSDSLPRG